MAKGKRGERTQRSRTRGSPPLPSPSEADLHAAIDRLLSLPATPDLLARWLPGSAEAAFSDLYQILLKMFRVDPGRALAGVRHLRRGLPDENLGRSASLARLEAHGLLTVGRAAEAAPLYEQSAELFASAGDTAEEARTTVGWTFSLALAGRPKEVERVGRRGRALLGADDFLLRARIDTNIATSWQLAGQFDRASVAYERAFAALLAGDHRADAGLVAYNLGTLALMTGRADDAATHCRKALDLFGTDAGTIQPLYSRTILAAVDLTQGKWNEGFTAIAELREAFETRGDARARGWLHRELALLFSSMGALEAAAPEAEAAFHLFKEAGLGVDAAHAAILHGRLLGRQGRAQAAAQRLEDARSHFLGTRNHGQIHRIDLELARLHLEVGAPADALRTLAGARKYLERTDPFGNGALARAVVAEIHLASGRSRLAIRLATRAYRDARRHPAKLERPGFAITIARAHAALSEQREAVRWAEAAVRELERNLLRFGTRQMRILVGGARDPIYGRAIDLILQSGGTRGQRRAVDLLSRARSPNLIEDLLQRRSDSLLPEVRSAIVRLRDELLSSASSETGEDLRSRAIQDQIARLDRRLPPASSRPPGLARRAFQDRGLNRWSRRLAGRDVLLYDRDGSGAWRAFLVRADRSVRLVQLPQVESALERSWFALRLMLETASRIPRDRRAQFLERTLAESLDHLSRLREALWDPIPWSSERVILVPCGDLHAVPLEALAPVGTRVVSRLPHPALLRPVRRRRQHSALLLAGPEESMSDEVRDIGRILGAAGFEVTQGNRREDLDRVDQRLGVLHVAAHGVFHPLGWLLSGLQLADGWFGLEQLRPQHLEGALVHLTSCESGRVGRMPGTDVEGWTTAALAAGAREVILAGWRIDGDAARAFATRFYSRWAEGADAAVAAHEGRAELRERYHHPYYWAAFLAVG